MTADLAHISDEEVAQLKACNSDEDWTTVCLRIKEARGDKYPHDWFHKIVLSGLMDEIASKWGGSSDIKLKSF